MPFKSAKQAAYLAINKPDVYKKFKADSEAVKNLMKKKKKGTK